MAQSSTSEQSDRNDLSYHKGILAVNIPSRGAFFGIMSEATKYQENGREVNKQMGGILPPCAPPFLLLGSAKVRDGVQREQLQTSASMQTSPT